eukprot:TRINITY_DN9527_c0_g1_i1.p1 TRINITY_DN9527_c0_g1~~TRINITY_DN9527_c0_g1_i1.p1  ORF type:complete len:217 (+),score=61.19 TRINITY_DN9527_c0_g1_i1:77-727(+)
MWFTRAFVAAVACSSGALASDSDNADIERPGNRGGPDFEPSYTPMSAVLMGEAIREQLDVKMERKMQHREEEAASEQGHVASLLSSKKISAFDARQEQQQQEEEQMEHDKKQREHLAQQRKMRHQRIRGRALPVVVPEDTTSAFLPEPPAPEAAKPTVTVEVKPQAPSAQSLKSMELLSKQVWEDTQRTPMQQAAERMSEEVEDHFAARQARRNAQ